MAACPYNARVFNWSEPDHDPDFQTGFKDVPVRPRGVMEKCTLCKERCDADPDNEPMCVVCCPSSSRVYGDLDAPNSEIFQDRPADSWPGNHGHVERHVLGGHARSR